MVVVMRTEKKVSEETGTEGQEMPCQHHCNRRLSAVTLPQSFPHQAAESRGATGRDEETLRIRLKRAPRTGPETPESLKVHLSHMRLGLVLIRWLQAGQRLEETVPIQQARRRRLELEAQGAVVYWSERLAHHG